MTPHIFLPKFHKLNTLNPKMLQNVFDQVHQINHRRKDRESPRNHHRVNLLKETQQLNVLWVPLLGSGTKKWALGETDRKSVFW
jgi:adenylate kinase